MIPLNEWPLFGTMRLNPAQIQAFDLNYQNPNSRSTAHGAAVWLVGQSTSLNRPPDYELTPEQAKLIRENGITTASGRVYMHPPQETRAAGASKR